MIKIVDSEDYYLYLIDRVGLEGVEERAYSLLFHELYKTEFMWSNPMDENRALDGTDLRRQYMEETGDTYIQRRGLNRVIDVQQVDALLFYKTPVEDGKQPTEDNFYVVPIQ